MNKLIDTIITGEVSEILKHIPDESVDMCITSPPYYGLRDYGKDNQIGQEPTPSEYIDRLVQVFKEVKRILKKDGTLWINIGDSYAGSGKGRMKDGTHSQDQSKSSDYHNIAGGSFGKTMAIGCKPKDLIGIPWMLAFALRADGWYLRQDIIWAKGNPMPESVKDRCTRSHEYIFMLSKSRKYYFDNEAIKEPAVTKDRVPRGSKGNSRLNSGLRKQDQINRRYNGFNDRCAEKGSLPTRNKRDVWFVNTKPCKEAHFAVFPQELIRPAILAGCPQGGIVIDPFIGSGTTGITALQNNRHFIGIDINPQYAEIAKSRIRKEHEQCEN